MKLNGDFALHPELQKFKALWDLMKGVSCLSRNLYSLHRQISL